MMTDKQPEALRLADAIEDEVAAGYYKIGSAADCAAPELRRLHDENERLRTIIPGKVEELNDQLCDENDRLHEVNEELLASVKELLNCIQTDRDWNEGKRARAAIAKATGVTHD